MTLTPLDELLLSSGATVLVALLLGRRLAAGWMVSPYSWVMAYHWGHSLSLSRHLDVHGES